MTDIITAITAVLLGFAALLFLSFVLAWPVMELWNQCLVPAVDGTHQIGWLQAWGLQFLFNLLFKATLTTKKD
jgi:hypothetical protein